MSEGTCFEIITGTYEEYLLGYIFSSEEKTLVQSFASHDHSSSVRSLATSGNYLASGASDDRIIVYDLKARKEHCMLTHHESTITALAFTPNHSHVISASQDGALGIVRVGNWQLEKLWQKAHKEGTILDITLHSSGKLALTLGSDATIHTWNLVKGREAYIINLKTKCKDPKSIEKILFAPDDTRFLIFGGKYTEVWSIELGGAVQVIEHDEKVTCCIWLNNNTLFVGYEDGNIATIDLETEKKTIKVGHSGRVKGAQFFGGYIATGSSSGEIKVWTINLKELCKVSTGCRITCFIIAKWAGKIKKEEPVEEQPAPAPIKKPVKRTVIVEVDESESEEERQVQKAGKKRKKKQKKSSLQVTEEQGAQLPKNTKKKSKHTSVDESIHNSEPDLQVQSDENVLKKKINKKGKVKNISKVNSEYNKLELKKKRKKMKKHIDS